MENKPLLGYISRPGVLHRLSGTSKLILMLACIIGASVGADVRYLLALSAVNIVLWFLSNMKFKDFTFVLVTIAIMMVLNNIFIFLFAPAHGTELFGTKSVLWEGVGRWQVTWEQLYYQSTVTLKYFAVMPTVLLFMATTRPPEFAAALNRIGIPYRSAYAVNIAMRYIPDIQREYHIISKAQQARGLDTSRRTGVKTRVKNTVNTIFPLLLGTFERIEEVNAAMELRGFGCGKKRTWYGSRPFAEGDYVLLVLSVFILAVPIALRITDGGPFWNPFS